MSQIYHYATVSKALDELNEKGFTFDFNLHEEEILKNPENFEIKYIYRYEGNSNPDDESIVYGIQSKSGKKGVFVAGFSANSVTEATQILINITIKAHNS
ncbi:MAG: hypothetical protein K2Y30_17120 [Flavobacteriaceae bacterium]|uniref:Phosphoribosylpyrophosphate synthetase n=1 Tax=Flavobacterium kayseriense TaxID=2764714 RepID=A0ABR7JBB2_9FLAO|nr:hypothetical protein [Flavobacterium kayseriense]MBC5842817.1 hypothetical protein [Flavobacterium kayseriense]MBC5849343.1 hypothetical protein [Flavobacterium kayseriense]MBU0940623.1 hypothetical protein [Bacteroidota bacterium]MBX9889639.1 hypothetical protein [Flavobacteriaceae bacterium]